MARALQAAGVEVVVATTDLGTGNKVPSDTWLDTEYGRVKYYSAWFPLLPGRMMRAVVSLLTQCDVAHLTSLFYPPSLFFALFARWHGKPVIWSPRGELDEKALVYSTWKKIPFLWLIRRFLSKKVTFHSTSPEETLRVRNVIGANAQVVEIPNFMQIPERIQHAPATPYLLCIGRVHPKKAIENLIAALPLSESFMRSECTLKIAGDHRNAYGEQLQKQVASLGLEEKVAFLGLVEGVDKQQLYAHASFSILPSHTENFGNVVIESLAQGTPVIASRGTPWQALENEKVGFWPSNDPAGLAAAIEKALSLSRSDYADCRERAVIWALQRFDVEANIGIWIQTYEALAASRKS